jgi:hypothetical protein
MREILPPLPIPLYGVAFKYKYKCNFAIFEVLYNLHWTYKIILFLIKLIMNRILEISLRKDLLRGTEWSPKPKECEPSIWRYSGEDRIEIID